MPKKRKTSRKTNSKKQKKSFSGKGLFKLLIIAVCIFLSYCVVLDFQIRKEFEGKRWSVPARVYAQPLELYAGKKYDQSKLVARLKQTGYQAVKKITGSGQFQSRSGEIDLYTREFNYWDAFEPAQKVRIGFINGRVTGITDLNNGVAVTIIRLAPALIGKIFPWHDEDRVLIHLDEVPPALVNALIAVEDRSFYQHAGVDPRAILRSVFANLIAGKFAQGGSTLTQQLVKNMFLTRERTLSRKINEMLMALMLDYHYSKEAILVAYINEIYMGQNGAQAIHGFGTAAEFYFSKPIGELDLSEIALLVGLVKGASYYNPRNNKERALNRRNLVLQLMHDREMITMPQYERATRSIMRITQKPAWSNARYPAFLDLVRRHLKRDYEIEYLMNEGLQIHTTLDIDSQEFAQSTVTKTLRQLDNQRGFKAGTLQTALVLINQHNGEILALMGDRDKDRNSFNRALDAYRAIGSLVKPAIYMTALDSPQRYHVLSKLDDSRLVMQQRNGKQWRPGNYDNIEHGDVPLVRAIAKSYNLATVRLGMALGLDKVVQTLKNLGVSSSIPHLPSMLLGSLELSPYEVTQMYQTIASGGLQIPLGTIRAVLDKEGRALKRYDISVRKFVKPETAFLTQFLLTEAVSNGTAKRLTLELPSLMPLAGKTGTTNELRDSWFAGFGDDMLAVAWVGRDDNKTAKLTGSSGAMQLWLSLMKKLKPAPLTLMGSGEIVWRDLPDMSGSDGSCRHGKAYPFIKEYVPTNIQCF